MNAIFLFLLGLITVDISMVRAGNITAISADLFVESIGVNTHWAFSNIYTYNYTGLKAKLAELGIRYVRDRSHPAVYNRSMDLYNTLGIKTIMVTGRYENGSWPQPLDSTQIPQELNEIKTQVLDAIIALEAPNEYDLEHGSDTNWVENIRNYTIILSTKAKADEILRNFPVIGPSLTSLEAYEAVGNLDPYIDYVNLHMYFGDTWTDFPGWDKNGSYSITWFLNYLARQQSPSGKRVQATETGYHNYISHSGVSEEADGKYVIRAFAEFFRRGIYRSYKYELVNQNIPGQEGVFGLLHHDLSEKASFRAVKTIIALLGDKGPSFEPGSLSYTLTGSTDNVRQLLFQKRDGDFYLMAWLEVPSFDMKLKVDLYPSPQIVVINLENSNKISSATLYSFNNNADINNVNLTINNNEVAFNATDKISIIQLSSSSSV